VKLARYRTEGLDASWGVVAGDTVVDVPTLGRRAGVAVPSDIRGLLALDRTQWLADWLGATDPVQREAASVNVADVQLLTPITSPEKVIGIGRNYRDHATEADLKLPRWPKLFPKFSSTIIGPGDAVVRPTVTTQLDFEVELGVVIGRTAVAVSEADAMDYVAGYTVVNDVSARDIQFADEQLTLGKNFATFCPVGPVVTTKDELPDPAAIELELRLNGKRMQHATTADLIFSVPYLVAFISYVLPLSPGDIIVSGTPAGVGCFRTPPVWLQPGDVMESTVTGVGTLVNPIVEGTGSVPVPHEPHASSSASLSASM
jgi:2-keto-4-pentenoate hydratase/2-oxohepta-3-ene-1,7-dioic acid hydratase in catechol pathway